MKKTLLEVLAQHGIDIVPDFTLAKQRNGSQWLFLHEVIIEGKVVQFAYGGDYATDTQFEWCGSELATREELERAKELKAAANEEARAMRETGWDEARLEVTRFLNEECTDRAQPTPYMIKKKIDQLYGCSVFPNISGKPVLVVPIRDIEGKLWNCQRIYPEKMSAGDKFLWKGAKVQGCFFTFGELNETTEKVYVCEGFATGASIFKTFNESQTVISALNAGNLKIVCGKLREYSAPLGIIICGDNDRWSDKGNTGKSKALEAAAACGGEVRFPHFTKEECLSEPTDFNDLHCLRGLDSVHDQILHPEKYKEQSQTLEPILKFTPKGRPIEPSDREIAERLTQHYKDADGFSLIHQGGHFFGWTGTHWRLCDERDESKLWQELALLAGKDAASRKIDSALRYFTKHLPRPSFNIFTPNRFVTNFTNGTLYIDQKDGNYTPRFVHSHQKEDYVTFCLPFEYLPESPARNQMFEEMLDRVWLNDPYKEVKKEALQILAGNCIVHCFSRIAFFVGGPGTGKSTILKLLSRLISEDNISYVDPTEFHGFRLVEMVGKLVNLNSDISTAKPLIDNTLKRVIDQQPFAIDVKNKNGIKAPLPPVHIYAMNKMPRTTDGGTGAYNRRVTVFVVDRFQPDENHDPNFENQVWESSPQGFANWAVQGALKQLSRRGAYPRLPDSIEKLAEMESENNPIARFWGELCDQEILDKNSVVMVSQTMMTERNRLFDIFKEWETRNCHQKGSVSRKRFYNAMRGYGLKDYRDREHRYFIGCGIVAAPNSEM